MIDEVFYTSSKNWVGGYGTIEFRVSARMRIAGT